MAHLLVVQTPEGSDLRPNTIFPLNAVRTVIGRDPAAAKEGEEFLRLPHHAPSRRHAAVELTEAGYVALDVGSRSWTAVGSRVLDRHRSVLLHDGDRIRICDFIFEFRQGDPAEVTPPPSSAPPTPPA